MKLRTRLLAFSSAQLAVFGVLIMIGYYQVNANVLPMLQASLRDKAEATTAALGVQLDVGLGADDQPLMAEAVGRYIADPDLQYLEVRDAKGARKFQHGTVEADTVAGAKRVAHVGDNSVRVWTDVSLEGVQLGTVAVIYNTARIDSLRNLMRAMALVALALWIVALGYSLVFARAFVRPIRAMIEFAHDVAGGQLGGTLAAKAPGELAELATSLDHMSTELASRDAERARASAKEAELQREIIAVSRMAGMAEVATGVLHNVGNVLNSLNVSVSLVGDRLRKSKIASLQKSVDLFSQHPDGLAGFLTTEKGKLIPKFLSNVSKQLVDENTEVCAELDSVVQNVSHIKAIVATQQSYAQVAGVTEPVELGALIDDALHMSEASFTRHQIELVKEYVEVPTLNTDRHKLLQIVINLVSNARHAVKESGVPGKLTVKLSRSNDRISIVVRDSGVGISSENLRRVFQHGFTTKKGGHGFGLHSCANAARELGGKIDAESEGPGLGATFTLDLPVEAPQRQHVARS